MARGRLYLASFSLRDAEEVMDDERGDKEARARHSGDAVAQFKSCEEESHKLADSQAAKEQPVQNFLPQMASANAELRREMDNAPLHEFDIEHVDASTENVIEMNVALVELSGSDTEEEESVFEDDSESEDSSDCDEVTVENFKLPKSKEEGRIEILDNKISK
ncbi:hypothetical protein EYD10_12842 [Varanus komodoensis]|nr:hypothetical protein EYD10_12842 [Varanus komodoensis]